MMKIEGDNYTLYHGDCLDILPTLEAGSVDAVITDPPYGMGKASWDRSINIKWLSLCQKWRIVAFCGVRGLSDYPRADWYGAWVRLGSTQRNGVYKGFNNWEPLLFYNIDSLSNDVIALPNYHVDYGHPTTKPIKLMIKLILRMSNIDDTILDPFMGSGTTGVAAMKTGRKFIGIELEKEYFDIAHERIANAAGDFMRTKAERESGQLALWEAAA